MARSALTILELAADWRELTIHCLPKQTIGPAVCS